MICNKRNFATFRSFSFQKSLANVICGKHLDEMFNLAIYVLE
jgi:hypothetical protein